MLLFIVDTQIFSEVVLSEIAAQPFPGADGFPDGYPIRRMEWGGAVSRSKRQFTETNLPVYHPQIDADKQKV